MNSLRIIEPFHGAVLNHRNGTTADGGLRITVRGEAPLAEPVTVNGQPAERAGHAFHAEVLLEDAEVDITARCESRFGTLEHQVRVVHDRHSFKRYRFAIDDNSFFLRDIAREKYRSLFDCFYLALLRDLHDRFGAKFVLNIYYTTEDGFELPQFPDVYRGEWKDNAHWLKLAFHAQANEPARPYQYAGPDQLLMDIRKVDDEIRRFAGQEAWSPPTVIHWGMVQPAALKPLGEYGVSVLSGSFRNRDGNWDINYFLDEARSEYLSRHDALKDFDSGIVFSSIELICNTTPVEASVPILEPLAQDPLRAEIMDLFTHEQYFWPFYRHYIPDHGLRLEAAIRWMAENDYQPVFFHEGLLGNRS